MMTRVVSASGFHIKDYFTLIIVLLREGFFLIEGVGMIDR